MPEETSNSKSEIEIKVQLNDRPAFARKLGTMGFRLQTSETMERNTLYDTTDGLLRRRGQILRIRQYGERWILTHKARMEGKTPEVHKTRTETETEISDGNAMASVLQQLGYRPVFTYEKLRSEWTDGRGHVVIDVTPIGDFAELEGDPHWIDATADKLGISRSEYLAGSYGQIFQEWKNATGNVMANMTFAEVGPGE